MSKLQSTVSGFRLQVPSLGEEIFPPGTTILLRGRPGAGKSVFTEQFLLEGLKLGQHAIYVVTDTSGDSLSKKAASVGAGSRLEVLNLFLEKPHLINDISITVHQDLSKLSGRPVRLAFDSLSTLGMMLNPDVLPPWVLDQRARFMKNSSNVIALMVYDTGIHPPTIGRSLQVLTDIVLEMKLEDLAGEPKHLFRVFSSRGTAHSPSWYHFTIGDTGLKFADQPSPQP